MKNFFTLLFLIYFSILNLSLANDPKLLKVGISADYPPFEYTEHGEYKGFEIDLIKEVASMLNMKLEIINMDFNALRPALRSKRIDLIISSLTMNDERKKNMDFSDIYYKGTVNVLTKNNQPFSSFDDFENKKIGVQLGSAWEVLAYEKKEKLKNMSIMSISNINQLVEELKIGRIDGLIIDKAQAENFAKINKNLIYSTFKEINNGIAIGLNKNSPLTEKVNMVIRELKKDKLPALIKEWFNE